MRRRASVIRASGRFPGASTRGRAVALRPFARARERRRLGGTDKRQRSQQRWEQAWSRDTGGTDPVQRRGAKRQHREREQMGRLDHAGDQAYGMPAAGA